MQITSGIIQQIEQPLEKLYYKRKDGSLYTKYTKKQIRDIVDPYNENTFLWILKELDYPYIRKIWNGRREHWYPRSVFGCYVALMRLPDFQYFTWKDSDEINRLDFFK